MTNLLELCRYRTPEYLPGTVQYIIGYVNMFLLNLVRVAGPFEWIEANTQANLRFWVAQGVLRAEVLQGELSNMAFGRNDRKV
jgi:hypothetical protein